MTTPSRNPLKYLPAKYRKVAYGIYATAAVIVGALLVAGLEVGKAPEVLVYLGGALGVTAASNVTDGSDEGGIADTATLLLVAILLGVALLLFGVRLG